MKPHVGHLTLVISQASVTAIMPEFRRFVHRYDAGLRKSATRTRSDEVIYGISQRADGDYDLDLNSRQAILTFREALNTQFKVTNNGAREEIRTLLGRIALHLGETLIDGLAKLDGGTACA